MTNTSEGAKKLNETKQGSVQGSQKSSQHDSNKGKGRGSNFTQKDKSEGGKHSHSGSQKK